MGKLEIAPDFYTALFKDLNVELLPSVTQIFQLELAWLETQVLDPYELKERSAFFKTIDAIPTRHYRVFEQGKISTGYAVHDLYPSRARLHPQIAKGILNAIHLQRGETVLDPLCGSGTVPLEAVFLGANAIGGDLNPISRLMTRVKYEVLKIPPQQWDDVREQARELFEFVRNPTNVAAIAQIEEEHKRTLYYLALLAFFNAMRWTQKAARSSPQRRSSNARVNFPLFQRAWRLAVRLIATFVQNPEFNAYELGEMQVLSEVDARNLDGIADQSIDAVVTSPPYSLVTNYLRSDYSQLRFLGVDIAQLEERLIGLNPREFDQRVERYLTDMQQLIAAVGRVLKLHKWFVLVTGKPALRSVQIDVIAKIIEMAESVGFRLYRDVLKPVKGTRDEYHEEHILFFRKE